MKLKIYQFFIIILTVVFTGVGIMVIIYFEEVENSTFSIEKDLINNTFTFYSPKYGGQVYKLKGDHCSISLDHNL